MIWTWMRWEAGRQNSGYRKLLLAKLPLPGRRGFDAYLLRYPTGASVPRHLDPVPGRIHLRVNVLLRRAELGGECRVYRFCSRSGELKQELQRMAGRLLFFQPDIEPHMVTKVEKGERLVLSLGAAL